MESVHKKTYIGYREFIEKRDFFCYYITIKVNSSLMDANILEKGEDYDKLPESYVIFITENDVMKGNLPVYHADRIVAETGKPLGDGAHIVYVNGAYRDDSPIGRLMHDFSCKNPDEMYYEQLAENARFYKENSNGVSMMCKFDSKRSRENHRTGKEYSFIKYRREEFKSF